VRVEKVDETVARAKKLGGKVVAEPTDIPNIGRFAIVLDPQGAAIAVMRPAQS
jgi:predicted enzyme related to lactoylglutathione lyase